MDGCVLSSLSKRDYLLKKIKDLASTPAWAGQIDPILNEKTGQVTIQVRNRFVRDWVRESYIPSLQEELRGMEGEDPSLQFVVSAVITTAEESKPLPSIPSETLVVRPERAKTITHESLKLKYNFDSFVVGNSNQFAHAAARAVASHPGKSYNPLFIYGGVGLGKTHLLNAIGLEALHRHPTSRIIYLSAERFMNELIYCLRFEKMPDFRKKYRDNCDILLIDDIQFIAGKERTQEEFFHTFNHLHDAQKQIVLTSDRPPREIPGLEERLRSRFEWGLIADIQVPDLETRVAILKKKSEEDRIVLDDALALFLATHIKSNVRELEGSLIRLHAFATLHGKSISIELAKDVLDNVLGSVDRALTVEQIQKVVSDFFHIKLVDLMGKRRMKSLALPRQIAMYLCRKHMKSSFPEIGDKFGGKDHSTVVHAFQKIEKGIEIDSSLRGQVLSLEQGLSL